MAPSIPKKRSSIRAKATKGTSSVYTPPVRREGATISDSFINTKKDKQTIKRSSFVNRIEKANAKPVKRRRPSKKLITTLDSLVDALPDTGDAEAVVGDGRIRQKSLKSRPGALKRKVVIENAEKERFNANLAVLSKTPAVHVGAGMDVDVANGAEKTTKASATAGRWAALRGFINSTMEQNEAFAKK